MAQPFEISKHALFAKVRRNTMVGYADLSLLHNLCGRLNAQNIPGSFVECGVWRGGCAGVMAAQSIDRFLHLFDSFEGLPEPTEADGKNAISYSDGRSSGNLKTISKCVGTVEDVQALFRTLDVDMGRVVFHRGWFEHTVPSAAPSLGPIALLRLDGDWYESTKVCLENLYDLVVPGGVVILDDYNVWEGCQKATDEFRSARKITAPMQTAGLNAWFQVSS
jgi:O-methyltransferase